MFLDDSSTNRSFFPKELLRLTRQPTEVAEFTSLEKSGFNPTHRSRELEVDYNSTVSHIQPKRRQHSSPPLLHSLTPNEYRHVHFPVEMQREQVNSSVSTFRNEPSSIDLEGVEQNKTSTTCSDHELILLRQQVKLLQSDKEYLLNEIASLSSRLASTEHELAYERTRTETCSKEMNELRETVKAEQRQKDEEFARRLERQAEEFSGLARMEFIKMRVSCVHKKFTNKLGNNRREWPEQVDWLWSTNLCMIILIDRPVTETGISRDGKQLKPCADCTQDIYKEHLLMSCKKSFIIIRIMHLIYCF
ncbi:hypothetical protein AHF37_09723 [Paragonimus kellicotti]|nr:hypothetical protein AHF37_09723 [Paragonimus kellicotti]